MKEHESRSGKERSDEPTTGTGGIDIFYDNVGGEQLDGAIETLNMFGR